MNTRIRTIFSNDSRTSSNTIEDVHMAIIEGNEDRVYTLLRSSNISINQSIDRDPYRNTLLHIAIQMKNINIIKFLIEIGADLKIKNKFGESCCDLLSKSSLGKLLEDLLENRILEINKLKLQLVNKDKEIEELIKFKSNINNTVQLLKDEVINLKKRNIELEQTCDNLLDATMKKRK